MGFNSGFKGLTISHTQFVLLLPVYRRVGLNMATINVQQNTVTTLDFFVVFLLFNDAANC
jgi:hypothetical protein